MIEDRKDYLAAFAIGAVLGIGATLLLAPPTSPVRRIRHELEPAFARVRKGSRRVRREARAVSREFGKRAGRAVEAASNEAWRAAKRRVRKARKALGNRI